MKGTGNVKKVVFSGHEREDKPGPFLNPGFSEYIVNMPFSRFFGYGKGIRYIRVAHAPADPFNYQQLRFGKIKVFPYINFPETRREGRI